MTKDLALAIYVTLGVFALVALGFTVPPLTAPGGALDKSAEHQATVQEEQDHCEASLDGVNCECFANTSGYIQSQESNEIFGFDYMDREELARNQASRSC